MTNDLEKPFAVMAIGVPGSGKTTHLKPYTESIGAHYLSADEIRQELTGDEAMQSVNEVAWRTLRERAQDHLLNGRSVVIDATHARQEERQTAVRQYREMGARSVIGLWFVVTLEEALRRNQARGNAGGRSVPEHAIKRMHGLLEADPPHEKDGFDDVIRLEDTP